MRAATLVVLLVIVVAVYLISGKRCTHRDSYAPQVMHGVAGGIAGPIIDLRKYGFKEDEQAPFVI